MVRLRSERWYSADGQRRSRSLAGAQSIGSRRLVSLCFLLALVILLMQKAADPRYVRQAFRSLGVPLEGAASIGPDADGGTRGNLANENTEDPTRWQATCQDLVPRLLAEATENQISLLAQRWFARESEWLGGDSGEVSELPTDVTSISALHEQSSRQLEQIESELKAAAESSHSAVDEEWLASLRRFEAEWFRWGQLLALPPSPNSSQALRQQVSDELREAIGAYLDHRLVADLRDASPWRSEELTCFERLLQRCNQMHPGLPGEQSTLDRGSLVSTLQLESESQVYKGQIVRFRGSLRRQQAVERSSKFADVDHYWVLWLRGEDGSSQPVAVYATDEVASVLQETPLPSGHAFRELEVRAISAKRLAYASPSGVQVAPTLFAIELEPKLSAITGPALQTGDARRRFLYAVVLGILTAGLLVWPVWSNWKRSTVDQGRFREAARNKRNASLMILIAAGNALTLGLAPAVAQSGNSGIQPPWAVSSDPELTRREMLQARLKEEISPEAVNALIRIREQTESRFPDLILRTVRLLEQLDWKIFSQGFQFELPEVDLVFERVSFSGIVRLAMPALLTDDQQSWFQMSDETRLYHLDVQVASGNRASDDSRCPVYCVRAPQLWMQSARLLQPVAITGLLLKQRSTNDRLCVLAEAPQWLLQKHTELGLPLEDLKPPLPRQLVRLGMANWNLAWSDTITKNNQKPLQAEESEAFYSLMRLVSEPKVLPPSEAAAGNARLEPLEALANPVDSFGKPVHWNVRVVSGEMVAVDSPEAQRQLGQSYYLQFDGFVDIGNRQVRYQAAGEEIGFEREFPITLVSTSVENLVPAKAMESGETAWRIGKFVELEGCFYRLWSYPSEWMQQRGASARQAAPLVLVARMKQVTPALRASGANEVGWFGYALCAAVLVILGVMLSLVLQKDVRRIRLRRP